MTSMVQNEHHCTVRPNKAYTNFTWSFEDWSLLRNCKTFVSPSFVLHKTKGKRCQLTFGQHPGAYGGYLTSVNINFPILLQYDVMEASLSFLDENFVKLDTITQTFRESQQSGTLNINTELFDTTRSKFVRNDTLTLFLEITIVESFQDFAPCTDIWDANFGTDIYKNFKSLLDSKDFYDVTFVVGEQKLYAHRVILAANSQVFRAMFATEMKERKYDTVEIVDTDATVFKAFLCYMYTGRVSEIENVVDELIVVADKYQMMKLKKCCESYMSAHINKNTAVAYLLKAYHLSCTNLQMQCIHFVRANIHVLGNAVVRLQLFDYPNISSQIFNEKQTA